MWVANAMVCALSAGFALTAAAQAPTWTTPETGAYALSPASPTTSMAGGVAYGTRSAAPQGFLPGMPAATRNVAPPVAPPQLAQAPLARVVKNPDSSSGLPPYVLTDNGGTIQRYVEPVPGVDLEPYLGMVVRVRHDTGRTLLASQLELPPQPLRPLQPLVGERYGRAPQPFHADDARPMKLAGRPKAIAQRKKFADHDDATVQLIADEEELPDGDPPSTTVSLPTGPPSEATEEKAESAGEPAVSAGDAAASEYPAFPHGIPQGVGPMYGEVMGGGEPMYGGPTEMAYPGSGMEGAELGMEGEMYPGYGEFGMPPAYGGPPGQQWGPMGFQAQQQQQRSHFFAEVELNFIRAHIMENFAGKLAEKYELSPRVILGFDGVGHVDGRVRYWHYGRDTQLLGGGGIRVEFNVVDLEATRSFEVSKSEIIIAAGLRGAKIDLTDDDGDTAGSDLLGMTFATDLETPLCCYQQGEFFGVCGARISLLGGDWGQNGGSDFIPNQLQDDNVVVQELYAGVGYGRCFRGVDVYSRLAFEVQNWHSDALSQFAGGDSLGFLGPGIEIGAEF